MWHSAPGGAGWEGVGGGEMAGVGEGGRWGRGHRNPGLTPNLQSPLTNTWPYPFSTVHHDMPTSHTCLFHSSSQGRGECAINQRPAEWAGKASGHKDYTTSPFWHDHDLAHVAAKCLGHFIRRLVVPTGSSVTWGCLPHGVLSLSSLRWDSGDTVWGCVGFVLDYLLILKKVTELISLNEYLNIC